jgi:hypothetical protein
MLRIPHCLDNRLTDRGKVVSSSHRPRSILQKHYFSVSGTHFCYRLSKPLGTVRPEALGKLIKKINSSNRVSNTRPSACSILPRVVQLRYQLKGMLKRTVKSVYEAAGNLGVA